MSMEDPSFVQDPDIPMIQNNTALTNTNGNDPFNTWLKKTEVLASQGDQAAIERLFNFYATERSEKRALDWTTTREDNQYQRLVKDLEKAGISPYILSSATPGVSSYTGKTYTGSQLTSSQSNLRSNATDIVSSILKIAGTAMLFLLMGT